jgi:ketosteroid isomerase-like protein
MNIVRSHILGAIILVGALGLFQSANADAHKQDTAAITSAIAATDAAANKKDANGVIASYAPDFVSYDQKGKQTVKSKIDALAQMSNLFSRVSKVSSKSVVTNIVYDKAGATVFVTQDGSLSATANGKQHTLTVHGTYKDYWTKSNNVWLERSSKGLTGTMTVDGSVVSE